MFSVSVVVLSVISEYWIVMGRQLCGCGLMNGQGYQFFIVLCMSVQLRQMIGKLSYVNVLWCGIGECGLIYSQLYSIMSGMIWCSIQLLNVGVMWCSVLSCVSSSLQMIVVISMYSIVVLCIDLQWVELGCVMCYSFVVSIVVVQRLFSCVKQLRQLLRWKFGRCQQLVMLCSVVDIVSNVVISWQVVMKNVLFMMFVCCCIKVLLCYSCLGV